MPTTQTAALVELLASASQRATTLGASEPGKPGADTLTPLIAATTAALHMAQRHLAAQATADAGMP